MNAITVPVVVGPDRRLVIDLPASTPEGPADVVILPRTERADEPANPAREAARAKLLAAGALSTAILAPSGTIRLSDEEIASLGQLPDGARPSEDLIDEDRGPH